MSPSAPPRSRAAELTAEQEAYQDDMVALANGMASGPSRPFYGAAVTSDSETVALSALDIPDPPDWGSAEHVASLPVGSALRRVLSTGMDAQTLALSSSVSAADRRKYAARGWALNDGSYPIPDKDHLEAAAILAKSKHGRWQEAMKLIARRAKDLGARNPLEGNQQVAASVTELALSMARDDMAMELARLDHGGSG
jgi:hypothetical protein